MILNIEDPKDAPRKLLELINEFGNLKVTKLIHRNLLYFYRLTMKDQKEKFKKKFHLPCIKNNKIPRNKSTYRDKRPVL